MIGVMLLLFLPLPLPDMSCWQTPKLNPEHHTSWLCSGSCTCTHCLLSSCHPADQVVENPLKAEVRSSGGEQRINVVVRQAAAYQRTLLQVTGTCGGRSLAVAGLGGAAD
jgi:hypothetical protein